MDSDNCTKINKIYYKMKKKNKDIKNKLEKLENKINKSENCLFFYIM